MMDQQDRENVFNEFQSFVKEAGFGTRVTMVSTKAMAVFATSPSLSPEEAGEEETFLFVRGTVGKEEEEAKAQLEDMIASRVEDVELDLDLVLTPGSEMPGKDAQVVLLSAPEGGVVQRPFANESNQGKVHLVVFASIMSPEALGNIHGMVSFVNQTQESWEDRVRVTAVWVDDNVPPGAMRDQFASNGWFADSLDHVWVGEQGLASDLAEAFGILRVPVIILVDAEGSVIWQGLGVGIDFGLEIAALLDGSSTLLETYSAAYQGSMKSEEESNDEGKNSCCGNSEEPAACGREGACEPDNSCCAGGPNLAVADPSLGSWMEAASSSSDRLALILAAMEIAQNAEVDIDAMISQEVTVVSADGIKKDAKITAQGEFPETDRDAVATVLAAMQKTLGCNIDDSGISLFPCAEDLVPNPNCASCTNPISACQGPEEPAFVSIHADKVDGYDVTLCSSCYWTNDGGQDPSHAFLTYFEGRTQTSNLRHGRSTLAPELVSASPDVKDNMHVTVQCDGCATNPLPLVRYKCAHCDDYDLCAECFGLWAADPEDGILNEDDGFVYKHDPTHSFVAFRADK